jgi:hypothetical protein
MQAQLGRAATKLREAFGLRGACSRFRTTPAFRQRQQAGRSPNALRGRSSTETPAACGQLRRQNGKGAKPGSVCPHWAMDGSAISVQASWGVTIA